MGKRKRDNNTPPPPEITPFAPFAPHEVLQLEQSSSGQAESNARLSIRDVTGSTLKKPSGHQSPVNQNQGSSRSTFLRNARHTIGRHYSRRSSTSHCDVSPSKWSGTYLDDSNLSFKLSSKDHLSDLHYRETRDGLFHKPERIRSSSSVLSGNTRKIECGICQKRLQKKPFILDDSFPSIDVSVVAVLVCGHAYHADCLELKTSHHDKQDPPCPLCLN